MVSMCSCQRYDADVIGHSLPDSTKEVTTVMINASKRCTEEERTKRLFAIAFILMLCACAFAEEALPQSIGLVGVGNARELSGYIAEEGGG